MGFLPRPAVARQGFMLNLYKHLEKRRVVLTRLSKLFVRIFQHKNFKKILGPNLALFIVVTSFMPIKADSEGQNYQERVLQLDNIPLKTEHGTQYPVEKVIITQRFHFFHPGIDLDGVIGNPIKPFMNGYVENIQYSRFAYGNAITLNHGNGISSLYAHFSKIYVKKGQEVKLNTTLGDMGSTGRSSGDHLHFEIWENGLPINPLSVLPRIQPYLSSAK